MANTLTSQTILDGERLAILKFTNISDGTNESNAVKVNVSSLITDSRGNACTGVKINKIWASVSGMAVQILWEATSPVMAWMIPTNTTYHMCFGEDIPAIPNNSGTGKTGNITFTTTGAASGSMYSIILECVKQYG